MPLEASVFPDEVQVAFFVYNYLSDVWEGMSGSYMGKNWGPLQTYFDLFKIKDQKTVLYFMKMYEREIVKDRAE